MHRRLLVLGLIALAIGSAFFGPQRAAQATNRQPAPTIAQPPAPLKPAALDCNSSPFGPLLTVGGEEEIFVGYRGGSAPNSGWLAYSLLDANGGGQLQHLSTWLGGTLSPTLQSAAQVSGAATDINADGKVDFVQSYVDTSASPYSAVAHRNGQAESFWTTTGATRQQMSATAGDVTGDAQHDGEVVLSSRFAAGTYMGGLDVRVINGDPNNGGLDSRVPFSPLAYWQSNEVTRTNATLINSAVGDVDGDGIGEIVTAYLEATNTNIQIVVLKRDPNYSINQGNSGVVASGLREIAHLEFDPIGSPLNLKVAAGNIDSDYKDEIILANDTNDSSNPNFSNQIRVYTYDFQSAPTAAIVEKGTWLHNEPTKQLAMATGDTDKDGRAEIVLGYQSYTSPAGMGLITLDAEQPTIFEHNTLHDATNFRSTVDQLSLDVGDLDRDGQHEIVAAFRDSAAQLQVARVADPIAPGTGLQVTSSWRDGTQGRTNLSNITVSLGDWDNNSLKAHYAAATGGSIVCKQVLEPQITSAIFAPPYWQNIQGGQDKYGTVGKARSTSVTTETAVTTENSQSFSAYLGVGIDGGVASASLKATAGYEYSSGKTRSGSTTTGQTLQEGWSASGEGFVVYDNTAYNCYSYQLRINGASQDGAARFCENTGASQLAREIDTWDNTNGLNAQEAYQWAPVARDWANLALFRLPAETAQSSTASGGAASRAVDGNTDGNFANGSVMLTNAELAPWWQTDLGSSQPISKVRVWNRADCCRAGLANYYVFVSNTDFRSISNDPNVLKADSRVRTFQWTLNSAPTTTFLTLDNQLNPISGRYVRVQLANAGTPRPLALAEVQVFGANHVEPDRYPVEVRDLNPNDGYFESRIYDRRAQSYQWVRTRGRLLWNGAAENVLANRTVGPGNVMLEWSLQQDSETQQAQSESFSHSARIGVEFEVEAGLFAKVQAGGGYEVSQGVTKEESRSIAWGTGFELGGGVTGFPPTVNGQNARWPAQCQYGFQPYYYWASDMSSYGYVQRYLVLDYIVPGGRQNSFDLDRAQNLQPCYDGTFGTGTNSAPQAHDDSASTALNTPITIAVLANDSDSNGDALNLTAVGTPAHGTAVINGGRIDYTPAAGYSGLDTFSYTVSDGALSSTATVRVIVGGKAIYLPVVRR